MAPEHNTEGVIVMKPFFRTAVMIGMMFHNDLQPSAQDAIITKATPSAFVGTDLGAQLKKKGLKR